MDAITRRTYNARIPGLAALLVLAAFSFLSLSSPVGADYALVRLDRRDSGPSLAWRQENALPPPLNSTTTESLSSPSVTSTSSATTSGQTPTSTVISSTASRPISVTTSSHSVSSSSTTIVSSTPTSISITESSSSPSKRPSSSSSIASVTAIVVTKTRENGRESSSAEATPETTLFIPAAFAPTFTTTETSTSRGGLPTTIPDSVGATSGSKGFWANKGAVAATFVIVSLLLAGIVAVVLMHHLKKRNNERQRRLHAQLFDKYSDTASPGGSVDQTMSQKGGSNLVYDDSRFQGATVTSDYPFSGSGFVVASSSGEPAPQLQPQGQQQYQYQAPPSSSHGSHQTAYYTPNASQQSLSTQQHQLSPTAFTPAVTAPQRTQYMLHSQAQAAAPSNYIMNSSAPPVAYREPARNRMSYQQSIDSFYGGNSNIIAAGP